MILEKFGFEKLRGTNLTTDNLYTSLDLMKLCETNNMTFIGTIRLNRTGVSKEMVSKGDREEFTNVVWFEKNEGKYTITSYCVNTKSNGRKLSFFSLTILEFPLWGLPRMMERRRLQ
jgi:hypothetical protein